MSKNFSTNYRTAYKFDENKIPAENYAVCLRKFEQQILDSQKYWRRFGGRPDFSGKVVVEIGCGHGALCIDAAISGAKRVIGFDLMGSRIDFARRIVAERFPEIANRIEFHHLDINDMEFEENADFVISKDTFEHIMNLDELLLSIKRILREDGLLLTGFSPLYYSAFGDHGLHAVGKRFKLPWSHLIVGDKGVVAAYKRHYPQFDCHSINDLGLNKFKRRDFLQAFEKAGFEIVSENINAVEGASKLMPLFRLLNKVPSLEDYTTVSMYVMLRKKL